MNMKYIARSTAFAVTAAVMTAFAAPAFAQEVPAGYPADYADLIAKAKEEGTVSIYTSTDAAQSQKLQDGFTKNTASRSPITTLARTAPIIR
ncbi:hypothetical protein [Sinorhizobium psoraleae]|uniref:Uncharacterized protein n=1 Tax=Sinorhizobium psoraleae TaxID=520838 RepID=A0ABT4KA43_9HYPH|nr:hypothetical protein [Sinorhizobium psoraleae]MCZ4088822.1 hypothetical protein [Sinorhizobium psoraleae]